MTRFFLCAGVALALAAACPSQELHAQAPHALYDRLGGKPAIEAVVDEFVARAAADPRINAKFAGSDIPRLKFRFVQLLGHLAGGPMPHLPRSMTRVHKHMGVTDGEYDAAIEDLIGALD
jgi:hemoglobin